MLQSASPLCSVTISERNKANGESLHSSLLSSTQEGIVFPPTQEAEEPSTGHGIRQPPSTLPSPTFISASRSQHRFDLVPASMPTLSSPYSQNQVDLPPASHVNSAMEIRGAQARQDMTESLDSVMDLEYYKMTANPRGNDLMQLILRVKKYI